MTIDVHFFVLFNILCFLGKRQWDPGFQQPAVDAADTTGPCPEWGGEVGVGLDTHQEHRSQEDPRTGQNQNVCTIIHVYYYNFLHVQTLCNCESLSAD